MNNTSYKYKIHFISLVYLIVAVLCLLLTGCDISIPVPAIGSNNSGCQGNCIAGSGVQGVQVFVEPDASEHPITDAIGSAKKSVELEMYILSDRNVIRALEEAANRGVDVRVMLEPHPFGANSPLRTMDQLKAAGAKVEDGDPRFTLTHNGHDYRWHRRLYHDIQFFSLSPWWLQRQQWLQESRI